jgi:ubiquinone/menaquinone biosynthesis C-methylase UbiE
MAQDAEAHWREVWRTRSATKVSWYQEHSERSLTLIRKVAPQPGSSIIDVGGGASRLVDELVGAGYLGLTVLDLAEDALERTRQRLGNRASQVSWVHANLLDYPFPRGFQVWHDRAVLHFMTDAADRDKYVEQLTRAVLPGGYAIVATFGPQGPESCSGLRVRRYDPEELTTTLGKRFSPVSFSTDDHITPQGARQQFTYGCFRRSI